MRDDIGSGCVYLIFALVQLCTAEYVIYGRKTTLKGNLSLNRNRCHHRLITQLSLHGKIKVLRNKKTWIFRYKINSLRSKIIISNKQAELTFLSFIFLGKKQFQITINKVIYLKTSGLTFIDLYLRKTLRGKDHSNFSCMFLNPNNFFQLHIIIIVLI